MSVELLLSVVIPTRHRNDLLAACLDRLAPGKQLLSSQRYEVIVTDDGAENNSQEMVNLQYPWTKWVAGPQRGPAANRNNGVRTSLAPWIVFCDDDCLPSAGFLAAYAEAIWNNSAIRVFEGRTSADGPKKHPFENAPINETGGYLWSCNFAINRDTFDSLGGFNEQFRYAAMEDMDFRRRLEKLGCQSLFVPEASIIHPWRTINVKIQARRHVESQLIYASLHPSESHLFSLRQHLKNIARYYTTEFPRELLDFGWLSLRCQPLRWWDMAYRGWWMSIGKSRARNHPIL